MADQIRGLLCHETIGGELPTGDGREILQPVGRVIQKGESSTYATIISVALGAYEGSYACKCAYVTRVFQNREHGSSLFHHQIHFLNGRADVL